MACNCDYILQEQPGFEGHYFNCRTVWKNHDKDPRNDDGTLRLYNPYLLTLKKDVLYHLGLDTESYDLHAMFGDVKFVCMGGTKTRMREFAEYIHEVLNIPMKKKLINLTKHSHRYAMYKVGSVLAVNHGIGIPSMTILIQEIIKLLYYAKAKDPIVFRIGTSGGLQIEPGTVVVSSWGMNGSFEKSYNIPILGKIHKIPSLLDKRLNQELVSCWSPNDEFNVVAGGTLAADDFYRGQGRLDGPFCNHSKEDKILFLQKLCDLGVKNIEMEATAFSALFNEAGIRSAILCVTLLNRLEGDQVTPNNATLTKWQKRPMMIVGRYISRYHC